MINYKHKNIIRNIQYLHLWYLCIVLRAAEVLIKGMSVREKVKSPITDPVHKSIPVTDLEYRILDTREFQRLRHILQNSTAYQTFPSNTNTRFPHSLGVMHIAGKLFLNALANSSLNNLEKLLGNLNDAVLKVIAKTDELKDISPSDIESRLNLWTDKPCFIHKPIKGEKYDLKESNFSGSTARFSDYFLICTAYEAVRIGALVHDVGHMPLSHIFEDAAQGKNKNYWNVLDKKKNKEDRMSKILREEQEERIILYKNSLHPYQIAQVDTILGTDTTSKDDQETQFELHELGGLVIFNKICETLTEEEENNIYDILITTISKEILLSFPTQGGKKNNNESLVFKQSTDFLFWGFFHSFFANSFVDSDRLDYTLRDPLSSGISLANFNLELLYHNVMVGSDHNKDKGVDFFYVAWLAKATSTIELFFHQRYLGYKYIAFNHSVMRTNAIVKQIISGILYRAHNTDKFAAIQQVAVMMGMYDDTAQSGHKYFPENGTIDFDDAWFKTLFTLVLQKLHSNKPAVQENPDLHYLQFLLEVYLYRKSSFIRTIWKTDANFRDEHFSIFKEAYPAEGDEEILRRVDEFLLDKTRYSLFLKNAITFIEKRFKKEKLNIWVISEKYSPKTFSTQNDSFPIFKGLDANGCSMGFSELPPYIRSFKRIDEVSPKFNLFLVGKDVKNRKLLITALKIINEELIVSLQDEDWDENC